MTALLISVLGGIVGADRGPTARSSWWYLASSPRTASTAVHVHDDGRVVLVIMGLRVAHAVRFIPRRGSSSGFTNGIALVIASTQFQISWASDSRRQLLESSSAASAFSRRTSACLSAHGSSRRRGLILILVLNRLVRAAPAISSRSSRYGRRAAAQLPTRDDRHPIWRYPGWPSHFRMPRFRPDLDPVLLSPTLTVRCSVRSSHFSRRSSPDRMMRNPAHSNVELFAQGGPIVSPMSGPCRRRRHRADRHQRPIRREDAGGPGSSMP